jgi:hypothetical protein
MRGRSPGRARDPDPRTGHRTGDFKARHGKLGGRRKGTPNLISADLKKKLFEAVSRIGSDGNGKDGLVGYLKWVAMYYPEAYLREILMRTLAWQLFDDLLRAKHQLVDSADEPPATAAELDHWVRRYIGKRTDSAVPTITTDPGQRLAAAAAAAAGTDTLLHLAVAAPQGFCELLGAAGLPLPKYRPRRD